MAARIPRATSFQHANDATSRRARERRKNGEGNPIFGGFVFSETSPAAAGTAASSQPVTGVGGAYPAGIAAPLDDWESVDVIIELTGATGGTLAVFLQGSPDGTNWYDLIAWPSASGSASVKYYQSPMSLATNTSITTQVGKNLSPALAASTTGAVVNGAWTDRMRLVMVAGSGTSAGAAVIVRLCPQRPRMQEYGT